MDTIKEKILSFWQWFNVQRTVLETEINNGKREYAAALIGSELSRAGLSVLCETGGSAPDYSITLNPCSDKTAQFLCRFWSETAPVVPHWRFSPFRKPQVGVLPEMIHALGPDFALRDFRFFVTVSEAEQKYQVTAVSPLFTEENADDDQAICRLLFYLLLGEADTEIYLGEVKTTKTAPPLCDYADLDAGQFVALIAATPSVRPWPLVEDPTSLCFGYGKEDDDNDLLRQDIIAGISRHPQLISTPFAASDELRLRGGEFCYFYYAVNAANPQANAATLSENLFRVEEFLEKYRLGYAIGHATGSEFNYIDLMILDEPVFRALFRYPEDFFDLPVSIGYFSRGARDVQ